jgi:hypothetical protein
MKPKPRFPWTVLAWACCALAAAGARADSAVLGQLLYVPVYSEVPYGDKGLNLNLTATLSLRNTDREHAITVKRIDYYSAAGALVRAYLKQPQRLKPMASSEAIVKESDRSGGISASFLVEWESEAPVSAPLVEAVMVNSTYSQGVAFTSPSRVLEERR